MVTQFLGISPVLPSQDIERDVDWFVKYVGCKVIHKEKMYAVINIGKLYIHLQWHADTLEDPLLGGSVIRVLVKNLESIYQEFVKRGTINPEKLNLNTLWGTNEFGFYDLNKNAILIVESTNMI